ncbi:MAG: hypothetical protein IPP72_10450 [Chitinophagaceae bacterium]|nr:hypothetical protein [Chitinophagaceae bacterium]
MKGYFRYILFLIAVLQIAYAKVQTGDIKFITAIRSVSDYKEDGGKAIFGKVN